MPSLPPASRAAFCPLVEPLEARIAPAALHDIANFSFIDANKDWVSVHVTGTSGTVKFLDAAQVDLSLNIAHEADIATIVITSPSADFSITMADKNPGIGDDHIALGKISGPAGTRVTPIAGIFTIDSNLPVSFDLAGYFGTRFSAGGGLQILGALTGGTGSSGGLDLTALAAGTSVFLRDGIAPGGAAAVHGDVAGTFAAPGPMAGHLSLFSVSAAGAVQLGDLIGLPLDPLTGLPADPLAGKLIVEKNLAGHLTLGATSASASVDVKGAVTASSRILAAGDLTLNSGGDVSGRISVFGDGHFAVGRHLTAANVVATGGLSLDVTGSVMTSNVVVQGRLTDQNQRDPMNHHGIRKDIVSSFLVGGAGLELHVGGQVTASQLSGGSLDVVLHVSGQLTASRVKSGGSMTVDVTRNVSGATLLPDGPLDATFHGAMSLTQIGSKDSTTDLAVTGLVSQSRIIAGDQATLSMRSLDKSQVNGAAGVKLDASGAITYSGLVSGAAMVVKADGRVLSCTFSAGNTADLKVHGVLAATRIEATDGDALVQTDSVATGLQIDASFDAQLTALVVATKVTVSAGNDASVTAVGLPLTGLGGNNSAQIAAGNNVTVFAGAAYKGSIAAAHNLTIKAASIETVSPPVATTPAASTSTSSNSGSPSTGGASTTPVTTTPATPAAPALLALGSGIQVGGDLRLNTTGKVAAPVIEVGGDVLEFHVGGALNTRLRAAGDFIVGVKTDLTYQVVKGAVSATSLFEIGGSVGDAESAQQLTFGSFLGSLQAHGKLRTDLKFTGGVNRLAFWGGIGGAPLADGIADIVVAGRLDTLKSGSLYAGGKSGGDFTDGSGLKTGKLAATGGFVHFL